VKDWAAYIAAFACAFGAAVLCYMAAFDALMSGYGYGISGFVLLAIICPAMTGFVTFGVIYTAVSEQGMSGPGWAYAFSFLAVSTAVFFGLVMTDTIPEAPAALLLTVVLFVGGRLMISRIPNG
jgi:hypothetical protein